MHSLPKLGQEHHEFFIRLEGADCTPQDGKEEVCAGLEVCGSETLRCKRCQARHKLDHCAAHQLLLGISEPQHSFHHLAISCQHELPCTMAAIVCTVISQREGATWIYLLPNSAVTCLRQYCSDVQNMLSHFQQYVLISLRLGKFSSTQIRTIPWPAYRERKTVAKRPTCLHL